MAGNLTTEIMAAYDESIGARTDFCLSIERLIRDFIGDEGIRFVDVASRVKTRASLEEKIARKGEGRYQRIDDITDICGVRVIAYFEGDVRRVCDILEREFKVDRQNSVDKSRPADPDRFGYRSVHYVVSHAVGRKRLRENRRFASFKVEIQVRSILQHAWAEIEHDLGYKSADEVPALVKRKFSRLAGLLELADEEFMTIRKELDDYEKNLVMKLGESVDDIALDSDSYVAFVNMNEVAVRIDKMIAEFIGAGITPVTTRTVGERVSQMSFLGFKSIRELKNSLVEHEELIREVAGRWLNRDGPRKAESEMPRMKAGISTFYLAYTILLQRGSPNDIKAYVDRFLGKASSTAEKLLAEFPDFPK
ncbi:GTP pyrophosphokinase [Burkholderia ambifaria]|uniref:GTP pyrophosphokinase n=1 Tax=Burkholderia ambifaria TaxID=152480 RepID=UPI00158CF666|nr:hypothetical protein [Burkholderia ambifaria]WDR90612.1 hypothetical protein OR986_17365 [Burkholderia ambifaria]WDS03487.1 hypothetical protein OR985_22355 [Burkholderia ambifaria]